MLPILTLSCLALLAPQQPPPAPSQDREPRVSILRLETGAAPRIDGDLGDACWAAAPPIGALVEVEPELGREPSQRTVVRIAHTAEALYMAIECFDVVPQAIRATQRARDADLDPDDRVEWFFDTFQNRRNAVWFQIGAGGSRGDALIGTQFEKSWDTVWRGKARVTPRGWQAEVEIPFRSLAFPADGRAWRFNLRRLRRSTNEEFRWANIRQAGSFFRVADAGTLEGLGALDQGVGLDVVPYVAFQSRRRRLNDASWTHDPDAGGDVFYRITPSLVLAATFFTDFAETENDERQINLTRFPLFFPEKRDFFLRGASRFTFGPSSRRGSPYVAFFSRRIGLDGDGETIPLIAGVKLTGEVDGWEIGLLDAQMGTNENVEFERNLAALRVKHALDEQTTLGVIGTHGRPTERGENATLGVDFYHREPEFIGDQDLRFWAYATASQTSGPGGDGHIFGSQLDADGREWSWRLAQRWTTDDFNPELGFIRRTGVKEFDGDLTFRPRPDDGPIRNWDFAVRPRTVLTEGNDVEDFEVDLRAGFDLHSGDEVSVSYERRFEAIDEDFDVFDDIVIRARDYWTTRVGVFLESSEGRPITSRVSLSTGEFFGGESDEIRLDLTWRPSALLTLGGEYDWTRAEIESRRFTAQIGEARVDLDFTPELSLRNLVQYDNESEDIGFQSRLRWTLDPGSDLFVVVAGDWIRDASGSFLPDRQEGAIKLVYTLRF